MRIALLHKHYNEEHLENVKKEMETLGAPQISAVWMENYGHWVALEGCHRLRAAADLGLTPEIIEVEYSDELFSGDYDDFMISEVCDESWKATVLDF